MVPLNRLWRAGTPAITARWGAAGGRGAGQQGSTLGTTAALQAVHSQLESTAAGRLVH